MPLRDLCRAFQKGIDQLLLTRHKTILTGTTHSPPALPAERRIRSILQLIVQGA